MSTNTEILLLLTQLNEQLALQEHKLQDAKETLERAEHTLRHANQQLDTSIDTLARTRHRNRCVIS